MQIPTIKPFSQVQKARDDADAIQMRRAARERQSFEAAINQDFKNGHITRRSLYRCLPFQRELEDKGYTVKRDPLVLTSHPPQYIHHIIWDHDKYDAARKSSRICY